MDTRYRAGDILIVVASQSVYDNSQGERRGGLI
jgi:hypothetical protein